MPIISSTKPVSENFMYTYIFGFDNRKEDRIFDQILNGNYQPLYQYVTQGGDLSTSVYMEYSIQLPAEFFNSSKPMYATFQGETTFLHAVALWEKPQVIQYLADHGADFNQYSHFIGDINGYHPVDGTLLHYTAINGDWKAAEIMLQHHALPNIMNSSGDTVLDIAVMFSNTDYMHHLQDFIADHPECQQRMTHDEYLAKVEHEHDLAAKHEAVTLNMSDVLDTNDVTIAGLDIPQITTEPQVMNEIAEVSPSINAPLTTDATTAEADMNGGFFANMWSGITSIFGGAVPTAEVVL